MTHVVIALSSGGAGIRRVRRGPCVVRGDHLDKTVREPGEACPGAGLSVGPCSVRPLPIVADEGFVDLVEKVADRVVFALAGLAPGQTVRYERRLKADLTRQVPVWLRGYALVKHDTPGQLGLPGERQQYLPHEVVEHENEWNGARAQLTSQQRRSPAQH
jgi:hypothetical protein